MRVYIELFGGLKVLVDGEAILDLRTRQTGALAACLALRLGQGMSREELLTLLWPDDDPEESRPRLRNRLHALRSKLAGAGEALLAGPDRVQFDPEWVSTDVAEFETTLREATRTTGAEQRIALLRSATALYSGPLLTGFYQDDILAERARLEGVYREALQALTACLERAGDLEGAIEAARRSLAIDPLIEEAHCHLMRFYAAAGQPSEVLRQYQELERTLQDRLGEKPSESTRRLMESLREAARSGRAYTSVPAVPPDHSLPERSEPPSGGRRRLPIIAAVIVSLGLAALWAVRSRVHPEPPPAPAHRGDPVPLRPLWVARYVPSEGEKADSDPTAVVTDGAGNIFVVGFIQTDKHDVDFLTIKYDANGRQLWRRRYNGPGNDVDRARAVLPDDEGGIFVTGESDNGKGNGATRLSGTDFATIHYDAAGKELWVRRYNGPGDGEDRPLSLLGDRAGGVYVLGKSWGRGPHGKAGWDYALVHYDRGGREAWVARYDGGCGDDVPAAMDRDAEGNVYVTGTSRSRPPSGAENDIVTIEYSESGAERWRVRYGGGNLTDDEAAAIGVDTEGVYVVGEGRGAPGTPDADRKGCLVLHYSASGRLIWVRGTTGDRDRIDQITDARTKSGGTFVVGLPRGRGQIRTVYRAEDGSLRWAADHDGLEIPEDGPVGLAVARGAVYVLSTEYLDAGARWATCLRQYDLSGAAVGRATFNGEGGHNLARAVTLSLRQEPVVTLQSETMRSHDIVTIKYPPP